MPLSHRIERISEQVREELSQMLSTEVSDPGIGLVTITRVKVTADLSLARAYWTILGDEAERKKTTQALRRATPYIRHLLAGRLALRRAPEVQFLFDKSVAAQDRVEQIIQELHAEAEAREASPAPTDETTSPGLPAAEDESPSDE
ncbi:MAG: 30S ribosome-binding factor RbfA [Vicinamibacterales bacterium]